MPAALALTITMETIHFQLDLSSFASIRKFSNDFKKMNRPLHILLNNAGVMMWCVRGELRGHQHPCFDPNARWLSTWVLCYNWNRFVPHVSLL
jgi:NAD(P)-dependent dehydrogenase (short-subunit alcohol dehydrogenase family)